MSWSLTDYFPSWGDGGEQPSSGFNYQGGDQVNEKHLDYLWSSLHDLQEEVQAALDDIDSDSDGVVDEADFANDVDSTAIAGDGLKASGGNLLIEPADFAGSGLQDDGNDNLELTQVYTDEKAQDAVGNILSNDFIYDDAENQIRLDITQYSEHIQTISTTSTEVSFDISNDSYDEYRIIGRIQLASSAETASAKLRINNDATSNAYSTDSIDGSSYSGDDISLGRSSGNGTCFAGSVSIYPMTDEVHFTGPTSAASTGSGLASADYTNFSGTLSTIEIFTEETGTSFDVSLYGVNRE